VPNSLSVFLIVFLLIFNAPQTDSSIAVCGKIGYFLFSVTLLGRKNEISLIAFINCEFLARCPLVVTEFQSISFTN
jgi:hypothetical protein